MNKILYRILIGVAVYAPSFAVAYELVTPIGDKTSVSSPGQYIEIFYTYGLGFGALIAVAMITWGGVEYTVSESVGSKEDAKDRITNAILGLALLLVAALILQTINPNLLELKLPTFERPLIQPRPEETSLCGTENEQCSPPNSNFFLPPSGPNLWCNANCEREPLNNDE
ncbi:MAG: hypothetical protein AAB407_01225 [Patescibacteria group bacterium]